MNKQVQTQNGYSLALVVVVLLVIAMTTLLISITRENINRQSQLTTSAPAGLDKVALALQNFAARQKRLPCPANPADPTGVEAYAGTTDVCLTPEGVVPWSTLSLAAADALDSWSRQVSYRVYDGATGFTQADGLNAIDCNTSASLTPGVALNAIGACAPYHETRYGDFVGTKGVKVNEKGVIVSGVAYVLISHGATGYGSFGLGSAIRSTLPNLASTEYANTQVPSDKTYWKQDPSAASVSADATTHFDDIVFYKLTNTLLDDTKLAGRDWGTVLVDKLFSAPSVTTGAAVTLTITLSNTNAVPVKLSKPLVDSFPTNLVVDATPSAATTCTGGVVTAAPGGSSVELGSGAVIPARVGATVGTCTVTVRVSPTQPVSSGATPINYSNTIAVHALEVTPNMSAPAAPPSDAAAVRNMNASPTRVLTATPPPPIVTPSATAGGSISPASPQAVATNSTAVFTVTPNSGYSVSVGGTCGGSLVGNTFTTNPVTTNCTVMATFTGSPVNTPLTRATLGAATGTTITTVNTGFSSITFPLFTLSAFADAPNSRNVSAAFSGGIGAVTLAGSGAALTTSNNEGLRFVFNADYRYLGITLLNFNTQSGGVTERVKMSFYDASNTLITQITKQSCRLLPNTTTNFTFDPGVIFRRVDIQAQTLSASSTSSSFLLGGLASCAVGTEASCIVSGGSVTNDCP